MVKAAWKSLGLQFSYAGEMGEVSQGGDGETSAGFIYKGGFLTRHIEKLHVLLSHQSLCLEYIISNQILRASFISKENRNQTTLP